MPMTRKHLYIFIVIFSLVFPTVSSLIEDKTGWMANTSDGLSLLYHVIIGLILGGLFLLVNFIVIKLRADKTGSTTS